MARTSERLSSGIAIFLAILTIAELRAETEPVSSPFSYGREQLAEMEREMVRSFGWEPRRAAAKPASPLISVGTQRRFWAQTFGGYNSFYQTSATCRGVGERAYLFVEDALWNKRVRQEEVNALLEAFDRRTPASPRQGIYEKVVEVFGEPPDVDGDGRVYLLLLDIKENYSGASSTSSIAGYFSGVNEYSDQQARLRGYRSNEAEILYVDCALGDCSSAQAARVVAHELQHAIHFNADPEEEMWLDEGCSTFAELICGYGARLPEVFKNEPENSLVQWNDQPADYEQSGMFVDYLFEHWGGQATIKALVNAPSRGEAGVTAALRERGYAAGFAQVFGDWAIANYLDDERVGNGRYAYANYDLSSIGGFADTQLHRTYPAYGRGSLPYAAVHYLAFTGADPLELEFAGNPYAPLSVRVIRFRSGSPPEIEEMSLDELGQGHSLFAGCERLVVIPIASQMTLRPVSYSYAAKATESGEIASDTPPSNPEPVQVFYDDGSYNYHLYWTAEGEGSGVRFTPPYRPAQLISAEFFVSSIRYGQRFQVRVFADDGTGMPGRELMSALAVEVPSAGWVSVDLREKNIRIERDFHVMCQNARNPSSTLRRNQRLSIPFFGAENRAPISGRSWDLFLSHPPRQFTFARVEDFDYAIRATLAPCDDLSAKELPEVHPAALVLLPNYPNPFNSTTTIPFQLPVAGPTLLSVYDLLGQEICKLVEADLSAGYHTATWNGADGNGIPVASGVYLIRLQVGSQRIVRRIAILR